MEEMVDLSNPTDVEVLIRQDGKTLWINVDGVCRLRICNIKGLEINDARETGNKVQLSQAPSKKRKRKPNRP